MSAFIGGRTKQLYSLRFTKIRRIITSSVNMLKNWDLQTVAYPGLLSNVDMKTIFVETLDRQTFLPLCLLPLHPVARGRYLLPNILCRQTETPTCLEVAKPLADLNNFCKICKLGWLQICTDWSNVTHNPPR